jgi:putative transcriptional regulator
VSTFLTISIAHNKREARLELLSSCLISQWERGEKHPQGASLKLLSLVAKNGLGTVA